jgi:hypothetical protein
LGQTTDPEAKADVLQSAATVLDAVGNSGGLDRNFYRHLFVWPDFMEIHVKDFSGKRVVLHILHQGETCRLGIVLNREVHENDLGMSRVNQCIKLVSIQLKILRRIMPAVDHGRNPASRPNSSGSFAASQRAWMRVESERFHVQVVSADALL